jgi:hypothetical protein
MLLRRHATLPSRAAGSRPPRRVLLRRAGRRHVTHFSGLTYIADLSDLSDLTDIAGIAHIAHIANVPDLTDVTASIGTHRKSQMRPVSLEDIDDGCRERALFPQCREPPHKGPHIRSRTVEQKLTCINLHRTQRHARIIRRDASDRFEQFGDSPAPHVQLTDPGAAAAVALAQGIELIRASGTRLELDEPLTQHVDLARLARHHRDGAMAIDPLICEGSTTANRSGQHEFDQHTTTHTPCLDLPIGKQVEPAELRTRAGNTAMHKHARRIVAVRDRGTSSSA